MLFHLFYLNLLNVLPNLLRQKVSELFTNLISLVELLGQLIRIVTFTNEDILAATFSDLYSECQDLLRLEALAGSRWGSSRRTLIILPLFQRHALEIVILYIIQITR